MWRHLHGKFKELADEEQAILSARLGSDCGLRAYCEYNSDRTPVEDDLMRQGLVCLLYRPDSATWSLSAGPSDYFKLRLEVLITRAGTKLGPRQGIRPAEYWLHLICLYLRRTDSSGLFARSDTGGIITSVCESSAIFCCWLEKKALEISASISESPKLRGNIVGKRPHWLTEPSAPATTDKRALESKHANRRAMVDAYIEDVLSKTSKRISRKDFWMKAGYETRTEFERWQRRDRKHPNKAADKNFMRILLEKPHLK
jgi:hypothetical protein